MTEAYPLQWPFGKPRIHYPSGSRFKVSFWDAVQQLRAEVRRLGGSNLVISTNVELRQDGLPYASRRDPIDKGVAVYFSYKQRPMCFACDKWNRVGDNVYAIANTIDALRGIERWGTGEMVEQAFTGFVAIAAPKDPYAIIGVRHGATAEEVDAAFRQKAKQLHPDMAGGIDTAMIELNEARAKIKARL